MAYIKEFVPEDQKEKFDPEVFDRGIAFPRNRPYRWVVDHDRDIFLTCTGITGHGGTPIAFFAYSYQKQLIKFEANITLVGSKENGWSANWVIFDFKMPDSMESKKEDAMKALLEAIEIQGNAIGQDISKLLSVNISFKEK